MEKICSFCGMSEDRHRKVFANDIDNPTCYICNSCIKACYSAVEGEVEKEEETGFDLDAINTDITPRMLKGVLDAYVIGQDEAKKSFSVGIYNHYKRIFKQTQLDEEDDVEIGKSNILLIGPTGSGKTLLAQTVAKFLDVPIAISDATSLTEAGYVGEDVENILTRLFHASGGDVKKTERGIVFVDEIDKLSRSSENRSTTRDVGGEGVQQALLKLIEGSVVNIPPKGGRKHPNQDFISIDTTNILFVCGGAFDGLEKIIDKRLGGNSVGFGHEKHSAKQRDELLEKVEPDDLVHFGMIPELIGRLPVITTLNKLNVADMVRILTEPKNAIIKQYQKLFALDDVTLKVEKEALEAIAELAIKRETGARGLRSILEEVLLDTMFELPELRGYDIVITPEVIRDKVAPLKIKSVSTKPAKATKPKEGKTAKKSSANEAGKE